MRFLVADFGTSDGARRFLLGENIVVSPQIFLGGSPFAVNVRPKTGKEAFAGLFLGLLSHSMGASS